MRILGAFVEFTGVACSYRPSRQLVRSAHAACAAVIGLDGLGQCGCPTTRLSEELRSIENLHNDLVKRLDDSHARLGARLDIHHSLDAGDGSIAWAAEHREHCVIPCQRATRHGTQSLAQNARQTRLLPRECLRLLLCHLARL